MKLNNFDTDEIVYLNNNGIDITLEQFLNRLKLHLLASKSVSENNDIVINMLSNLFEKISKFTQDEWVELQDLLPFREIPYSEFDSKEFVDIAGE